MRFHVCGMPHAPTSKEHSGCAYTAKVFKFCKMMTERGHSVFHYGVKGSDPLCTENIVTMRLPDQFRKHDYTKSYYPVVWDHNLSYWRESNLSTVEKIEERIEPKDFVCIIGGTAQQPIAQGLHGQPMMAVEYGIGYYGTFANYRVFESYAHMHHVYGRESRDPNGKFYDCVIPNYFDIEDFDYSPRSNDYFLYVGRMIQRKGIQIALDATIGHKLILVGQGAHQEADGRLVTQECIYFSQHAKYLGFAGIEKRNQLMRNAIAIIVPSLYLEPFGGVAVEAQLCGTPAITTDWGAFPETVEHGVTGYRCRTLEQFKWAVNNVKQLDRRIIVNRARALYSLQKVGAMYEEYFSMLMTLWDQGWNQIKNRTELNWLSKGF